MCIIILISWTKQGIILKCLIIHVFDAVNVEFHVVYMYIDIHIKQKLFVSFLISLYKITQY